MASKLNNYFDVSCFATPLVIGADGVGTAFGNSGTGIVDGPGQANLDLAVSKARAKFREVMRGGSKNPGLEGGMKTKPWMVSFNGSNTRRNCASSQIAITPGEMCSLFSTRSCAH